MSRILTTLGSRVLLFLGLVSLGCSQEKALTYDVPDDLWSARLQGSAHGHLPVVLVEIDEAFDWPDPLGEPPVPVHYRVNAITPEGETIADVGRLTESERFSIVALWPQWLLDDLALDEEAAEEEQNERDRALDDIASRLERTPRESEALEAILEELRALMPPDASGLHADEQERLSNFQFELEPYADQALLRQESRLRRPQDDGFTWEVETDALPEPCRGQSMTPEACMHLRMTRFRDRLCADPRFANRPECTRLRDLLELNPPQPSVKCEIGKGVRGATDTVSGEIPIAGDYFLADACGEATLLHELFHAVEIAAGRADDSQAWQEAKRDADDANRLGEQALHDGDLDEALRQLDKLLDAQRRMRFHRLPAIGETIIAECDAYRLEREHADLFDYPGEGLAWMKQSIKDSVIGILGAGLRFDGRPTELQVRNILCPCLRQLERWIDAQEHADVRANLAQDAAGQGTLPNGQPANWLNRFDFLLSEQLRCP